MKIVGRSQRNAISPKYSSAYPSSQQNAGNKREYIIYALLTSFVFIVSSEIFRLIGKGKKC